MRLLLDEQISGKVAERLEGAGCDVVAVSAEASLRGLNDPDVFELAQAQARALVTYNREDFEAIVREYAARGQEHHGLVIVHPVRFPGRDFARLRKALTVLAKGEAPGTSFVVWLQEP